MKMLSTRCDVFQRLFVAISVEFIALLSSFRKAIKNNPAKGLPNGTVRFAWSVIVTDFWNCQGIRFVDKLKEVKVHITLEN